ncbi:hypothetical protein MHYMCMPSP_00759 [Hyalomma marginatum]|uniref:Uncharacterized protein n=1 Tax=Hyalomma marginatum TaxID=34627 RepID=A0A8S4C2C6_9ACAR|nr:hypothetical protein MHYMCMPASI_00534 [Hyalomma marginatum]CAG7592934.1 hypothetical protein MHYMCMPSP_00759 [Hyalomma marginatum]
MELNILDVTQEYGTEAVLAMLLGASKGRKPEVISGYR